MQTREVKIRTRIAHRVFRSFLPVLFCTLLVPLGCGPEESGTTTTTTTTIAKPTREPLNFNGVLKSFETLESAVATASVTELSTSIEDMSAHLAISLPMALEQPFQLHTFHDRLIKTTTAVAKRKDADVKQSYSRLLNVLAQKKFTGDAFDLPIDVSVARDVLEQNPPLLVTQTRADFTGFSNDELKAREAISLESFWQRAFLFSSNSGVTKEQDTGAVVITHGGKMVAILEFKNERALVRALDFTTRRDLAGTVATMPGYVSSVGRHAAYARLGIGENLFQAFFTHARARGIADSYLHVRHDNEAALNLYKKLGYTVVGRVTNYADALVMQKRL